MALVGPRSNVDGSPHGIVVDQSSRSYGTDIKNIDYGEVLETFFVLMIKYAKYTKKIRFLSIIVQFCRVTSVDK